MHDAELQMNQYLPKLAEFNKANDVSQRDSKVSGYKQNNYTAQHLCMFQCFTPEEVDVHSSWQTDLQVLRHLSQVRYPFPQTPAAR
jgi:hypothetical protein